MPHIETHQPDGSVVVTDVVPTGATDAGGDPVMSQTVVEVVPADVAATDRLPGVAEQIKAIETELEEARSRAGDVRSAFVNGLDNTTLEDVEAAEREAATAKLSAARAKAAVRREAEAERSAKAKDLMAQHSAALAGSTDAIDAASVAVTAAVLDLIRATEDHNARVTQARSDLLNVGALPEGTAVGSGVTASVAVDGATYTAVELTNRSKTVGVIPAAIAKAEAERRTEKRGA